MKIGYGHVARARKRELATRVGIGLFLAGSAYALAPSIWPAVWFAAMCASQLIDLAVFSPFRRDPRQEPTRLQAALVVTSSAVVSTIYSSIAFYMFMRGGPAGQIFAMLQCAGGLQHVALHMQFSRPLLLAAALPHAAYLLIAPVLAAVVGADAGGMAWTPIAATIVAVGAGLYMAHTVASVRQAERNLQAIRTAGAEAQSERKRAERASQAKSDFLATVSHEIRTPMNAVISAANLLKRTDLTPEQGEHVSMLLNAGDVLMGLLNDVLDLSKIEAGKMTLEEADLDLGEKLETLTLLWTPRAEAKGLALMLDAEPDLPDCIRTDPLRLQQILFNLLSNAVKFTESGAVTLKAGASGTTLWFEVEDTGCGVEADQLERLFNSFEQAEAATTRRHGGTGLGLAISRRLAELMGGSLTATSSAGYGSCFRLEVPLRVVARRVDRAADAQADAEARPLDVLIAEDHEVNQRILTLFLEPLGWRLTRAWDGVEAVEMASTRAFDIILMDMQMPRMTGLEATAAIREGPGPNANTPIVALTAAALDHHRQAWVDLDVDAYLTKPIQPDLLISTLTELASRPRASQRNRGAEAA